MTRNSTLPDAGGEFSSSMDCRTTLLPLAPDAEDPVAITVYCNPAVQLTVSLKTEVVSLGFTTRGVVGVYNPLIVSVSESTFV